MNRIVISLIVGILCAVPAFSQNVGLVLSGGGAKGAVHIGIIKALEENDIPIDYIAGTSIGAIVGSLYAMGYSPDEMLELFMSENFHYWQTGKIEENYRFYFWKNAETPSFTRLDIPLKDSLNIRESLLPNSLVNPVQMNQAFMLLFAQANAQCEEDFDRLFVPFLCIASDVYNKQPILFRKGDLGDAVRASMSFPLVFKPILKDSVPLWDGGIYDNFPVHPMKQAWNPDFIIGSAVAGSKSKRPATQSIYNQLENIVMQKTEYQVDPDDGVLLQFTLEDVGLLDFDKAQSLYELGYNTTLQMIDSIRGRVDRRTPLSQVTDRRKTYKDKLPSLVFKDVYISGTNEMQELYVRSRIHRDENGMFTIRDFKQTYFQLLMNPKIKEIIPHAEYNAENRAFDLHLDLVLKNEITTSFGGNISSMNANQIYLGIGYQSLTELSTTFNLDAQLGNAYNGFTFYGRLEIPSRIPLDVRAIFSYDARKFYESEKLFIDTDLATFTDQRETFGKIGIGLPFLINAKTDLMMGYGQLEDKYYQKQSSYLGEEYDRSRYNLFNLGLYYHKNSLNTKQYPISGQQHKVYAQYVSGKETFYPAKSRQSSKQLSQSYIQLQAFMNNYHTISPCFNLGYLIEGMASSKNLWSNYTASVLQAPGFTPTPHSKLIFNEAFHANQYIAAGLIPILKLNSTFHLRGDFYGFLPVYPIKRDENDQAYYGKLFTGPAYWAEASLVAQLSFMNVSLYVNHYSYPKNSWNFGLNIGYLIFGPKFIQ